MAAGLGTRLRPLTETTPKALLPVKGEPLIHRLIQQLVSAGITDLSINLHHHGEQIESSVGDGSRFGASVRYAHEPTLLETGGTIVKALRWLGDAPFIVTNADIYTDFDFRRLPLALADGDLAHLVLTPTPSWLEASDFLLEGDRVVARGGHHVYCSIGLLSPRMFSSAPSGPFSWRDLMFAAVAQGRVSAQEHLGFWHDIGTLSHYEAVR